MYHAPRTIPWADLSPGRAPFARHLRRESAHRGLTSRQVGLPALGYASAVYGFGNNGYDYGERFQEGLETVGAALMPAAKNGDGAPHAAGERDRADTSNIGRAAPKTGELFERTFPTAKGPVDFLAEVVVEGDTLILKDVVVYGRSQTKMTGLRKEALAARTHLIQEAKALGFKTLKIAGQRVQSGSSGNPGHFVEITVDLTK